MARLGCASLATALTLCGAFAGHVGCPSSVALVYASCKVEAYAGANCSMVRSEMMARIAGQGTVWQDPNNGTYALGSSVGEDLVEFQWGTKPQMSSHGNVYANKIMFTLATEGTGCEIKACSASQATSVADLSANYCNIRNLYCGVAEGCVPVLQDLHIMESSVEPSHGAGKDPQKCSAGQKSPQKVAVLGSGLGAMSAVFYMTNYPGWEQDWDIDVYQMGWSLGGKAASGRTMSSESGSRILEHGLHIFFAGYSNAFAWVKDMYKVWKRPSDHPLQSPNDAFKPSCNSDMWVNLENLSEPADWAIINQEDPLDKAWQCLYTVPETLEPAPTPWMSFKQLLHSIAKTAPPSVAGKVRSIRDKVVKYEQPPNVLQRDDMLASLRLLQSLAKESLLGLEAGNETGEDGVWPPPGWCNAGKADLPATHKACRVFFWRATYMELTVAVGFLADNILLRGCSRPPIEYESLDTWICRHRGPCGLEKDDLIRALPFAAMFAFINGNIHQPNISAANLLCAGRALESGMLGVGRFGPALTYRMQAGMGEIILTPAYEILKARGVRFHFFHKVEGLYTSDGETVGAIDINVQATVKAGSDRYRPLHPVRGLNVWPDLSSPANCEGCERFFDQLLEGDAIREANANLASYYSTWTGSGLKKRLVVGQDFDLVLNGITSGALPFVSDDLVSKNTDWRKFVETTKTVATVGLQVWTYNTTAELGYEVPKMDPKDLSRTEVMAAGGPEPYDTWADMTHLLQYETANSTATVGEAKSVQYWCSPVEFDPLTANLSDPSVPGVQTERAYAAAVEWLEAYTGDIMPKWAGALYESMVAPPEVVGRDRLRHQYYRLNFEPTELYVLTVAGSVKYRPVPWPTKAGDIHPFKNMALAGDHTRNGFNIGCAEATVTSGVHLAHALTNKRSPRQYVGYGHNQEHLLGSLADPDHYPLVGEELEPVIGSGQVEVVV